MSFNINVTPTAVIHSVQQEGQWVILDTWEISNSLAQGKFGFHIPSGDEIGLADFRLAPN
jgi:hypothetical protein